MPNPHVIPTPRYAAVVPPNGNGGEKRLVSAAPTEIAESCIVLGYDNGQATCELRECDKKLALERESSGRGRNKTE